MDFRDEPLRRLRGNPFREGKNMNKTIAKAVYDTETAAQVRKFTSGCFGDPAGYEETLYQTPEGRYFIYVNGGAESPYLEEKITRISKDKVEAWIEAHA